MYEDGVIRQNGTLLTEFITLEVLSTLSFELITNKINTEIDIQKIEEIEWDEINGVGDEQDKFILTQNNRYLCTNYDDFEMVTIRKLNQLIQIVKQLDRKIKEK